MSSGGAAELVATRRLGLATLALREPAPEPAPRTRPSMLELAMVLLPLLAVAGAVAGAGVGVETGTPPGRLEVLELRLETLVV